MATKGILFFMALAAAGTAAAVEPTVSDVSVRQLWPWSGDVDISFTVAGTNTDVKFTAQYDGVEPFELAEKDLDGDFLGAAPGRRHVRWSPARAGLSGRTLANFRIVSAEPDATDRTYLVLNLTDGSYRYMAAPPEGGWISDPAYYTTNMVFRRIPGGEAVLGMPYELREKMNMTANDYAYSKAHTVTLSSDFYLAVFKATKDQTKCITKIAAGSAVGSFDQDRLIDMSMSYAAMRGGTSAGIDWPDTQYAVDGESRIAELRKIVKDTFSPGWIIDLPTAVQWERAARADTPTNQLWSVGGTVDDSFTVLTNLLDQIAVWENNVGTGGLSGGKVGQRAPNGWGLYDMLGVNYEWNLDWHSTSATAYSGTDPVGPDTNARALRARRGINTSGVGMNDPSKLRFFTTSGLGTNGETSRFCLRPCIHLKSLFK